MIPIMGLLFGYTLFYWGLHHFPWYQRYSLFDLLGISNIINNPAPPGGLQFQKGGGFSGGSGSTGG